MVSSASTTGGDRGGGKPYPDGRDGAAAFDWPPTLEVLGGPAFQFTRQDGELDLAEPVVTAMVDESPAAPRDEEPHVGVGEVPQQRASTPKLPPQARRHTLHLRATSIRARAVPLALAAVALIAVVEGLFILRYLSPRPTDAAAQSSPTPSTAPAPHVVAAAIPDNLVTSQRTSVQSDSKGAALATHGRLVIRSEPAGAQVLINGRSYGITPVRLGNVVPGEHHIVLKRDGAEVRQTVRVEPGATLSVVAPLKPDALASGWVAIASPIEVDLFEGGALLGTSRSRQIMLEAGMHTLQLVNEQIGFQHTQQVRVQSGKVERIVVELPQTTIHLNATPWAEVWIDGKSVGETPIGNLPVAIGPHEVLFRHPELGEKVIPAVVKAGAPTRLTADLRR
jgi:hypothetical protein